MYSIYNILQAVFTLAAAHTCRRDQSNNGRGVELVHLVDHCAGMLQYVHSLDKCE